jgi:hypothetical protein
MHIAVQQSREKPVAATYFCKNAVICKQLFDFKYKSRVTTFSPQCRKPASLRAFCEFQPRLFTTLSTVFVRDTRLALYTNELQGISKVNP